MKSFKSIFIPVVAVLILAFYTTVPAQRGPGMMKKRGNVGRQSGPMAKPSGLKPVFPDQVQCIKIASPFGSHTRYDGSQRPRWAPGGGSHGGIDLTLAEKTPLLALAAGTVVKKGRGGMMEGIYIWLRHTPEDTGLTYWVYSKYQHLESLPDLALNAKVAVGQVIAFSGKTGTVGGHYGGRGYPHLHLTTRKSIDGKFEDTPLMDPLQIYHDASPVADAAMDGKEVIIPYATSDGRLWPQNTRIVWPVACRPK